MHDFVFKEIIDTDIETELKNIGFDKSYRKRACDKFEFKNIKIFSLSVAQANILKQTALSVGADCATHRETITGQIDKSDCILCGSVSQIKKIIEKLKFQPFGLKLLGEKLNEFTVISKNTNTKIAGILNLTENSFSDGGLYNDLEKAKIHFLKMIADGAAIIDIGAESTKPYAEPVSAEKQLEKLIPIVEFGKDKAIISIDTCSSHVAEECIKAGAKIINDVSGLTYDDKMAETIAAHDVQVVIQHSIGTSETMQDNHVQKNLMDEIYLDLKKRIDFAILNGIKQENIIIDPGIGFGKTREQNFEIIKRIEELYALDCPVMLGLSRKSLLEMQEKDNYCKDIFTVALNTLAVEKKVDYIRVHNVKLHSELLHLMRSF